MFFIYKVYGLILMHAVCMCMNNDDFMCMVLVFQAGYIVSIVMLVMGYCVVVLTVLSISAIATSANVETGGVYCIL